MRPAFDPDGNFLAYVYNDYAGKAVARGEAVETDEGWLVVIPQPMRELTPQEKRAIVLAKERAKR